MIVKLQPTFLNLQVRNLCCRSSTGPGRSAARPPTWQDDCKTAAHSLKLTSSELLLQIVNGPGPISGTPTNMDDIYTPAYDYLVSKLDITQLIQYDTLHLDAVVNWTKVNPPGRYLGS